ncbi:MAG: hypothetical protein OEX83_06070 [Gammaproteobacteria bacterium]|nr:hypothetical protein [Gammaproteobacteria bacterium]
MSKITDKTTNIDKARRRLAKASVAAVPVVLTLTSRPVLGAYCSVSGMLSGNLSRDTSNVHCDGFSPGYWGNLGAKRGYPAPYFEGNFIDKNGDPCTHPKDIDYPNSGGTKFSDVFVGLGFDGVDHTNETLLEVIWTYSGSLAFYCVAHLLNAASGIPTYQLTEAQIIDMWNQWATTGSYEAAPGVYWSGEDIKAFLEQTQH